MTIVIFRYDDYHADRGAGDASKSQIEYRLLGIFSRFQVPLTMGVVPNVAEDYEASENQRFSRLVDDREKLSVLKEAVARGIVEPALHGWQHQAIVKNKRQSEFMGLTFDEQLSKIQQGQSALESWLETSVTTFIPPWNTYDAQTIRALESVNVRALSAALGTASGAEGATSMVFLPRTCALSEFDAALAEAENAGNGRRAVPGVKFIVMMFHHFSFFESDDALARQYANVSLTQLESIVERCARDETIQTLSIGEAAQRYGKELRDGRFAAAVQYDDCLNRLRSKRYVGQHLARRYLHRAYYPVKFYQKRLPWLQRLTGPRGS